MQRNIKLIGLDLDGTTLNDKKEITPRVRHAIANAIAAGVAVLPATGRARQTIPAELLAIPGVRYALCANGALVYDLPEKKTLIRDCFTKQTALALEEALAKTEAVMGVFIDGVVYSAIADYNHLRSQYDESLIRYLQISRTTVPNLHRLIEGSPLPVEKFSLLFRHIKDREHTLRVLESCGDCEITCSMPDNLEVNAAGVNKGDALLKLASLLGLHKSQVMAVGDGRNDAEMLKKAGYGVAMGNAVPEALAAADWVTASNEEDGVAVAIEAVL